MGTTGTLKTNSTRKKKKMGKAQFDYLRILEKNMGLISPTIRACGILSRNTHYEWLKDYEGFKEAVNDIKESMIDFSEGKLYKLINEEDTTAIIFHLKCLGKNRGYIDKQITEIHGKDGTDLTIRIVDS